jgi:adenylate cyclase
MAAEIERKFLVAGSIWRTPDAQRISQGYLNLDKLRTVRVRIAGTRAYLAVKGITTGASRTEFEYEIPLQDAEQMLGLCDGPIIEKVRHKIKYEGLTWEVDEFLGENAGLVLAEVELDREDQVFKVPSWATQEVTTDARYYNSNLASNPYSHWASKP